MSFAQFLGQTTPYYSTGCLSLGQNNWSSFLTTPDIHTNIALPPNGDAVSVFTSPTLPQGFYYFSLQYQIQGQVRDTITYSFVYVSSTAGFTPPIAYPVFQGDGPPCLSYTQISSGTPTEGISAVSNVMSGIIYCDGTENSQIKIDVAVTTADGTTSNWMSFANAGAETFPSLSLFKIG